MSVVDQATKKSVVLKDGIYVFKYDNQNADISIKYSFIHGTVTVVKGDERTKHTIEKSIAKKFTVYAGDVLLIEGERDIVKAYYREDYPGTEQKLERRGALNKNKHCGLASQKYTMKMVR